MAQFNTTYSTLAPVLGNPAQISRGKKERKEDSITSRSYSHSAALLPRASSGIVDLSAGDHDNAIDVENIETPKPQELGTLSKKRIFGLPKINSKNFLTNFLDTEVDKRLYNRVNVETLPDLDVPGGLLKERIVLRKHQRQGVKWMMKQELETSVFGGILADEMGLGL